MRVVFYFSLLCPTLVCTIASLKVPAMIVHDVAARVLDTKVFPQITIADLISGITLCFVQSGEACTVK